MLSSIAVSITDDDCGEEAGRMKKLGTKRKRKKAKIRGEVGEIFLRMLGWIFRWKMAILLSLIVSLFLFEWWRISEVEEPQSEPSSDEKVLPANLDRMDMPTRSVNGTREPCLKIMPLEDVEQLELPDVTLRKGPVKRLIYKTDTTVNHGEETNITTKEDPEGTRLNLFTGFPTLSERADSLKVKETSIVHCGFYGENGGFTISNEDKSFMRTCKAVVSTCAFGGGDDLYQPIGVSQGSLRKVCYVAFWDDITKSAQEAEGTIIGDDHMIGKWRIVVVKGLPFSDQRLNGKVPKMLSHRLFPEARYSIWVDSKSQFRRDPIGVFEALLWRTHSSLAISEHGARSNVYDEGKAIVRKHKATPEEVDVQLSQYRHDGFPDDKRFNGKKGLAEASVIIREHNPTTNLFMCLWFNEVVRFTSRDQLSFPYVLRQFKGMKINMFPVCTRKSLVNSIGHRRKVKPLNI